MFLEKTKTFYFKTLTNLPYRTETADYEPVQVEIFPPTVSALRFSGIWVLRRYQNNTRFSVLVLGTGLLIIEEIACPNGLLSNSKKVRSF